jgi:hypothetical protein
MEKRFAEMTKLDRLSKVLWFRQIADQYLELCEGATDPNIRIIYSQMAGRYVTLAQSELTRAEEERAQR